MGALIFTLNWKPYYILKYLAGNLSGCGKACNDQKGTVLFCIFLTLSTILKQYQKYKTEPSPFDRFISDSPQRNAACG